MLLKAFLVLCSFVCCAGALFATLPTEQELAEWKSTAARSASGFARSAQSAALNAMPSSGDVARFAATARLRVESLAASAFGDAPAATPPTDPEPQPPAAAPECRLRELDAPIQPNGPPSPALISRENIECPPHSTLPPPWCDPRVQAVLRLLEEDRARRGLAPAPFCDVDPPAPAPAR